MLSPRDDEDDDNHLCIKCNATIVGLENYIKHRKEKCGKKTDTSKIDLPLEPLEPSYGLGADVFFQSLELQSSVKKSSLSSLAPLIPISKASIDRKTTLAAVPSTSRDIPRMSPLETNLRGEDWIGGHTLRIGINEDNQTKLFNAVANISGAAKKDITNSYEIGPYNDFKCDEDSEETEESDDDEEEESHLGGGKWKPPVNYTGGKWRPASPGHEEWEEQEHTGGKWKLLIQETNERDEDYDAPPPDHTKGKWVPGAHEKTQIMQTTIQRKGSVQYWCGPCNRRLGSRAIYEKHLMSNLHMKKVLPEHELEFSGHLEPIPNIADKRAVRPSRFLNDSIYSQEQKKIMKTKHSIETVKTEKKKRNRRPFFVKCPGCDSRVRLHLMGKHLISHYHFRKATEPKSEVYRQLIFDNIEAIVHQSPFQCSPCKFYTNLLSNFMQHWFSQEHNDKMSVVEGRYWCSFCKYECDESDAMLNHMTSSDHKEVVAVINRSMPIIIRKKTILKCGTCGEEFRYNIEVKSHCQKTGHLLPPSATDDYQEMHKCHLCTAKFKSSLTLAAHLKSRHKQKSYFCLVCSKTFASSKEAVRHRQTSEHRVRVKQKQQDQGIITKNLSKKCPHCTEKVILPNILKLKEHIQTIHPNIKRSCPHCGMSFILPQEVTRHVRANACRFEAPQPSSSILWSCSQCLFTTDSQAECFFHEGLHSTPLQEVYTSNGKEKLIQKYPCPLCPKNFRKSSLRLHLRQHTFERPFCCDVCGANFTRQSTLANHRKSEHVKKVIEDGTVESWCCEKCFKEFPNESSLTSHKCQRKSEERLCPYKQCSFVATTAQQLTRHYQNHGERLKIHQCHICDFKTDQSSHYKRHMICHEGAKPYACPHCPFTCGSLENLRKHVIKSGKHPGEYLYKCDVCNYKTNMATDLRSHLVNTHGDLFNMKSAVEIVKQHLFKKIC